ncbi:MAG TPA: DMT family protein [Alphaproteobacteria bacterium]
MATLTSPFILPIILLALSNAFMTLAWYGHLKVASAPMWIAILASWGIALIEYCLAVPANRIGIRAYSLAELKTIQEIITLIVFVGFAVLIFDQKITWQHGVGFVLIAVGAAFIFYAPKG